VQLSRGKAEAQLLFELTLLTQDMGRLAADLAQGRTPRAFPRDTAIGSLCHYISAADPADYQPANITFDLLPALDEPTRRKFRRDKKARHAEICRRAIESMDRFLQWTEVAPHV